MRNMLVGRCWASWHGVGLGRGVKANQIKSARKGKTYIVVSKRGMTPWATCTSKREAAKQSRAARMHGLDGEVVEA